MTPLRTGKALLCFALLAPFSALAEEEKVSVTVNRNSVVEHESVQLRIQVDSPLTTPVFQPTFDAPDFTVLGSGMSSTIISEGGQAQKTSTFTFVLMPKRVGDFKIRAIEVKVGNKPIRSSEVAIEVVPDGSPGGPSARRPQLPSTDDEEDESFNPAAPGFNGFSQPRATRGDPASMPSRLNSDFTVWATVNKRRAYVGEPLVVEYHLYDFGGLRQTEVLQWPTFTGFWKDDLELTTHVSFEAVYLRNQEMRRAFIARYALYGIKPGRYNIDKLGIRGRYATNDLFNAGPMFGFDLRTGQHYSQDLSVEVLPLPEAGRPKTFSGAVGKFSLKLEVDKQVVPQNTPVAFTLTLSGVGNIQAIDSIKLPLPADFELYDSTASGKGSTPVGVRRELETQKVFQVIAIPRKTGKFEVPALAWAFFNPEKEAYETLTTQPLALEVTENAAAGASGGSNTYLDPQQPTPGNPNGGSYRPLKEITPSPGVNYTALFQWLALGLLLGNLVLLFRRASGRSKGLFGLVRSIDPFASARFALLRAKGRDVEWQAELEEVILMAMQVLLHTNPRGLTKQDLEETWKGQSLPPALFQRINALLEEIDRHRFSSQKLPGAGSHDLRSKLTREAESIIAEAARIQRKK